MIVKNSKLSAEIKELEQVKFIFPYLLIDKHIFMLLAMIGKKKLAASFSTLKPSMRTLHFSKRILSKSQNNPNL